MSETLISTREAADLVGVSPPALRYHVRLAHIQPARQTPGGHYLFDRSALEQLVEQLRGGGQPLSSHERAASAMVTARNANFPASWRDPATFATSYEVMIPNLPRPGDVVMGDLDLDTRTSG
ncbi:MAG: hypothetical protein NVS3B18_07020 [Candidatus Dormibacteria bacterium]